MHEFVAPIFIIAAPRSGSTLLYEALSTHPSLVSVRGESHHLIEGIPELSIVAKQFESNELTASDATPSIVEQLHRRFFSASQTCDIKKLNAEKQPFRFLEKTPKNALRIPFINAMYPDAKFVYLVRDPFENISSIMEAWLSKRFVTYPQLPGWRGDWSLLLPPGWRSYTNRSLASVAAFQWSQAHNHAISALKKVAANRVHVVTYRGLVEDPNNECQRIFDFAELNPFSVADNNDLPLSRYTLSGPQADKWHKHAHEIEQQADEISASMEMINDFIMPYDNGKISYPEDLADVIGQSKPHENINVQPKIPPSAPINRNALCYCGSNKRYKHCHGKLIR